MEKHFPCLSLLGPTGRSISTTHAGKPTTPSGTGRVTTPGVITNIGLFLQNQTFNKLNKSNIIYISFKLCEFIRSTSSKSLEDSSTFYEESENQVPFIYGTLKVDTVQLFVSTILPKNEYEKPKS